MKNLSPLLVELIAAGKSVKMTVTGNSMYPFLRHGRDSVLLVSPSRYNLKKGSIVLIQKPDGFYTLHRVISIQNQMLFLLGDAQTLPEGPFAIHSVIAVVNAVYRSNWCIPVDSLLWIFLSCIWSLCRPIRARLLLMISHIAKYRTWLKQA